MKSDLLKNKRKVLATLLLCTGFIAGYPLKAIAAGNDQSQQTTQQQQRVTGIVKDTYGEPIIGASVVEKGTSNGVISDLDGNFSINVRPGATIQISYIGYVSQELKASTTGTMQITMREDSKTLDEVVVVGFGTQKKVNLTGSVGVTTAKELASRPVANATQALQGLIPGLQISQNNGSLESTPTIKVRGTGTIGKGSKGDPLVLIDGMEGDLNTINPQDIENVTVLKDAASSSIYGSRAPFGVILVTTKRGKAGKTSVNYNNSFRWGKPINMAKTMDSYTFATYWNDGCLNTPGWGKHFGDEWLQRIKDYQNGTLTSSIPAGDNGYWQDGYAAGNANVDWYGTVYKSTTFSQEHNASVSGGTDKLNYYLSFNYLDQGGFMRWGEEGLERYNATAKINAKLTDWASVNYSMRWTREDYIRPSQLTDGLYDNLGRQGWPTLPLYDPNGYLYASPSPVLGLATGGSDFKQTDNLYHQLALVLEPVKGWITNVEFNYRTHIFNRHWDTQTMYNHDVAGNPYVAGNANSNVHEEFYRDNLLNLNIYSEYNKTLAEKHNFRLMGGFQTENLRKTAFGLQRNGILIPELPEVDLTSGLDQYGEPITPSTNGERHNWSTAGFFGRLNYDLDGRYLFEANLRYDGTSRFRRDNRWILLPSVSFGWNIAREKFWKVEAVNTLKLRASYGLLGNQNTDNWYQTYRTMEVKSSDGSWLQNGAKPNTAKFPGLVSESLTWEKIYTWNGGLDWGLFDNRLTGSFDYFVRDTKDMVGPTSELPSVLGTDVPKSNNTDLRTHGWEFEIAWKDRLKNGLGYGAKFMLSDARTKIMRYPNNPTNSIDSETYIEGRYINEIWGYETIGIAKSDEEMQNHLVSLPNGGQDALGSSWGAGDIMYKDINGDGKIDQGSKTLNDLGDRKVVGNSTPRYFFSVDLSADWKGFDVRAFFQGVMKRDYFQGSSYFWGIKGDFWWSQGLTQHTDYFRPEQSNDLAANLDSYYPRPVFGTDKNYYTQTRYLQDASYIRLKNLQIGYTLPQNIVSKIGASNIRVYFSGENLWTGTSLSSLFDPETIDGGKGGCVYPLSKTFSCGLSLTF